MKKHLLTRLSFGIFLLGSWVVLGGCAASNQSNQVYSSENGHPAPIIDMESRQRPYQPAASHTSNNQPDTAEQVQANTAVAGLLQQAAQARAAGDYARAQSLAERAQTLAPHEARSYLELSRIYQDRGDRARSRQMALRGLSVVSNDPHTENELQLLSSP
jgi:hypothetical protein